MNLAKVVPGYLKERPEEQLHAWQISGWIFEIFPEVCQAKEQSNYPLNYDGRRFRCVTLLRVIFLGSS